MTSWIKNPTHWFLTNIRIFKNTKICIFFSEFSKASACSYVRERLWEYTLKYLWGIIIPIYSPFGSEKEHF